ncbi:MAG: type I restriction endonuclease subunit R [Bacteroidota bacterium]
MTIQPEQLLENNLVQQLEALGYTRVQIREEKDLLDNLKRQLEKHNGITLSDKEFQQVLHQLNKGNIFQRAATLRDRVLYRSDTGEAKTLQLLNLVHWCQNEYQVAQQINMTGSYRNRYDVTLLINGLPLVQIELKRRGLEMKEAFNQINRYERHSYSAGYGLFNYIQLFVISNGVNTKYFANNPVRARSFKQTFYWADRDNRHIRQLQEFADVFLEPCHVSKMICQYMVLHQSDKILMVLRPYQYYATEAIIDRVKTTRKNGFIWHTTGSGKTLTSFKTAQILSQLADIEKVLFVVDRNDLDYQTVKEFNSFSEGSVDATDNTGKLVDQLADDTKLIVTTIQKLNNAVLRKRHLKRIEQLRDQRMVFIFDECHRSQFGKTHKAIKGFFRAAQLFGFTGTPIFPGNAGRNAFGKRTTTDLFDKSLHEYLITDAIRDQNVLRFSVEYMRTFRQKDDIVDIDVEAIDQKEVMEAQPRLEHIVDYIIQHHNRKTNSREFTAIFCVANVPTLIRYMQLFLEKQAAGEHDLKVATIFSYQANEEDEDAVGVAVDNDFLATDLYSQRMAAEPEVEYQTKHSRDHLEDFMAAYNTQYLTNYTTRDSRSFYSYYKNIAQRVKAQQIDVLLVVNMFLTGFDSKHLNTLYVDKNLRHHGLIQAFSRTNRILNKNKSQGNIVCFRNLKAATDEAIVMFSNKAAVEEVILEPYEDYVEKMDMAYEKLLAIAPTVDSVNELPSEEEQAEFIQAFRDVMRLRNVLNAFTEFTHDDLAMDAQTFEDYKSKYLDLYQATRSLTTKEKASILNDLDFELELIRRDDINVAYILQLLAQLQQAPAKERAKRQREIEDLISGDITLRSKKELIDKFIQEHLPKIADADDIPTAFEAFWTAERALALAKFGEEERLEAAGLKKLLSDYLFTEREPIREDIISILQFRPTLRERRTTAERVIQRMKDFVQTFVEGIEV